MPYIRMKKIAIVILNWNGCTMMERYLPSVVASLTADSELIVADNASTDNSIEMLRRNYPAIKIIQLAENYGFAEGYNRALKQIDNEYAVLLNSDVETPQGWIEPLEEYMETHSECAACQPKLLSWSNKQQFEYAGGAGGFIDRYGYPFCRGRIFADVETDRGQYDENVPLMWATGACLMVRMSDFCRAGGFDKNFFAHNEEIDLCWRFRRMGREVRCVAQSRVYHLGGGTLPQGNPRKTYLNFRNNLAMLYKNLPDAELKSVMRCRRWLDYIAAAKSLLTDRNMGDFRAIVRARKTFREWLPELKKQREEIKQLAVTDDVAERKPYSILYHYYIKGRKKFSQLP